jgi:hypothetical protein
MNATDVSGDRHGGKSSLVRAVQVIDTKRGSVPMSA